MDSVGLVTLQAAVGAGKADLLRLQQGAKQTQKQGHAKDHDDDRDQAAGSALQRDVAKTGRCKGRHSEIERIDIVADLRVSNAGSRRQGRS